MTFMPATLCLMNNVTITTALTAVPFVMVQGLARAKSIGFQLSFNYGSGGTHVRVWIQTSFDGGQTFWDVAAAEFLGISDNYYFNVSGLTPVTWAAGYDVLTSGTLGISGADLNPAVNDGFLGDRWRALVTTTGTYAGNTTLGIFANARD